MRKKVLEKRKKTQKNAKICHPGLRRTGAGQVTKTPSYDIDVKLGKKKHGDTKAFKWRCIG